MKNKSIDLHNHLFIQLERLNDENITHEALAFEIERSKAIASISKEIISNSRLVHDVIRSKPDLLEPEKLPDMLT